MFRFRKKRKNKEEEESVEVEETEPQEATASRGGKGHSLLETVRTGLNSQWFRGKKYSILKELEGGDQKKGVIDDTSRERAIGSILGSLERAVETFSAGDDQEGLRDCAAYFLDAYAKIGDTALLERYVEVCSQSGMEETEIKLKLVEAADKAGQFDVIVTLYTRAAAREKLIDAGHRALNVYLEVSEIDMTSRTRLFHYVVEAYKSANDIESLILAGDRSLKYQIDGLRISREKDWLLDAQMAYKAAQDNDKLTKLANQYVNLYLKEGLETWLDKAIVVYEDAGVDPAAKLRNLADKLEERGRTGMADTMRRKADRHENG